MPDFLDNIKNIPQVLAHLVHTRKAVYEKLNCIQGASLNKIVCVGSGTSMNAAHTAKLLGEQITNLPIELCLPNTFVNYTSTQLVSPRTLYVFISQGGRTTLVHEGLAQITALGCPTVSITEDASSPIAQAAPVTLDMGTGIEPFLYRTTGYSATVVTLYLLFLGLAGQNGYDDTLLIADMQKAIANLDAMHTDALSWYNRHKASLGGHSFFWFAGAGYLHPTAQEACIKFMEMLPAHTLSFELEELMHGPQNAFAPNDCFFLLHRHGQEDTKTAQIHAFITQKVQAECHVVSNHPPACGAALHTLSTHFFPLEYIAFFQVVACQLALDHKRNLSQPIYPSVGQYFPKTMP